MCKRHATPKKFGDAFDGPKMWASLTLNLQRAAPNRSVYHYDFYCTFSFFFLMSFLPLVYGLRNSVQINQPSGFQ
ncbi:unnamed protein product, partial [Brassica oleracea var. botrytis]